MGTEENMPGIITREEFVTLARTYVARMLDGICEKEVLLAADWQPHTLRIIAKLSQKDFQRIRFSDLYPALRIIIGHLGTVHIDPEKNAPHNAEFKLYDPYFATLHFQPIPEGA